MTAIEKRWAECIFAAVMPVAASPLAAAGPDTTMFWRCMSTGAPTFLPGLRSMVLAIVLLPLFDRRFLRPFPMLSADQREAFLVALDGDQAYLSRQLVATVKILACFARFDSRASEPGQ
ncbi:MAG: hypothetical protein Q8P41_12415 [Pseudomonadota bacterium]|nr:hypothetical protein [Pseudomonadota bacterium]